MRIKVQLFNFTIYASLACFSLPLHQARSDGGEDYYKALRKLKTADPAAIEEIKKNTIDAEQVKKVNALSKKNNELKAKFDAQKSALPANLRELEQKELEKESKSKLEVKPVQKVKPAPVKKSKPNSDSSSSPIKVNSDIPDELSFPGLKDDEKNGAERK